MNDLDIFSRPVTYISYKIKSNDGKNHDVKVLLSASTAIAVNNPSQQVSAQKYAASSLSILKAGTLAQPILKKKGDDLRIDWGYMYVAVPNSADESQYITGQGASSSTFVTGNIKPASKTGKQLELNTVLNFGSVGYKL